MSFDNLEIIISQRKKPFIVVLQLLMYNKTVKNRLFREVASLEMIVLFVDIGVNC